MHEPRRFGADVMPQRLCQHREESRGGARYAEDQAAAAPKHPPYLPQGGMLVGHELETQLAQCDVERLIRERHGIGARLVPLDGRIRRCRGARDGQHPGIEVQPGDHPGAADLPGCEPRDHTGATRDVQHPLARTERREPNEIDREGSGNRRDKEALVVSRWISAVGFARISLGHALVPFFATS